MDISAMERSKSRSRRGRSLPGADEYDLEMGRPMKWARNRARSRRRERRRQRRGREQAGPAEDNSSAAMPMMLCACGIVVVFLVGGGIFIAYQRGAFSSGRQRYYQQQPQQQQVHYVTQPNQGYQPTQPNHGSEGTSTDQTTVAEQATSVVGSSRQEQVAELHRRHQIIMSTSTTSYSQLKEHLNWIRLESYWAMTFSNNRAFWRSTNNTRCWFGSNGGRRKNLELSKESVRQKAKELIQTCTSPDRTDVILELCRNSGIHPRIRDILDKAERRCGDKTFTNKFSEAWKEAYVEFYCYCHHVDQVYKKLENDYLVKWYDEDGYVWRHSTWCSVDAKGTPLGKWVEFSGADPRPYYVQPPPKGGYPTTDGNIIGYLLAREKSAYVQGGDPFSDWTDTDQNRVWACGLGGAFAFVIAWCTCVPCMLSLPFGMFVSAYLFFEKVGGQNTWKRLLDRAF